MIDPSSKQPRPVETPRMGREWSRDEPFLEPVEDPQDPSMRQAYAGIRQQYGRVITPVRVHSARLPIDFLQFYGKLSELDKLLKLPRETALLVREQVARINVCLFCTDSDRWAAIKESMNEGKFNALDQYDASPLFSAAERALLDYVTELTRDKRVSPEVFERMATYHSEQAICEVVWLVASEHLYNMTNIGLNIHSDMLCDITRKK